MALFQWGFDFDSTLLRMRRSMEHALATGWRNPDVSYRDFPL